MLLLFDKSPDRRAGPVKEKFDASRVLSLKSFLSVTLFFSLLA